MLPGSFALCVQNSLYSRFQLGGNIVNGIRVPGLGVRNPALNQISVHFSHNSHPLSGHQFVNLNQRKLGIGYFLLHIGIFCRLCKNKFILAVLHHTVFIALELGFAGAFGDFLNVGAYPHTEIINYHCFRLDGASDLAKIARYAIKRNMFRKLISTGYYSFSNLNTGRTYYIGTTNALLGNLPGVQGMKTGYTNKAGYCFVGLSYSQKGNTYISVVLGGSSSASRWEDSRRLLTYAYYH